MSDEDIKNDAELQELLKNTSRGGRERTRRKCTIEKKAVKTKVILEVSQKSSKKKGSSRSQSKDKNEQTGKQTPRGKSTSNSRAKSSSSSTKVKSTPNLKVKTPKSSKSSKNDEKSKKTVATKSSGKTKIARTKSPSKIKLTPKKRKTKKEEDTPGPSNGPQKKKKKSENIIYKDEAEMSEDSSEFDNSEDEWGRMQKEEHIDRKISAEDFHISSQSSMGSQLGLFESRDVSSDAESEMQEPSLNELIPALSQFGQNERQEYQYDVGNDEMIELQLVGNSENVVGNNVPETSKPRRTMFRGMGNADEDTEPATQEQIETEWQDVEIQQLTNGLEYVRKAGGSLGLYGLSDQQANVIHKKFIPSKTIKQIKSVVFANINEHVLTTTDNPLEAWDELFQFLYTEEGHRQSRETLNAFLVDRSNHHRLEKSLSPEKGRERSQVDLSKIYKYLSEVLMQDLNVTKLDRTNTICLLNSLENIEKQARLISCKELDDEMNKRYSALLINRKSVKSAQKEREHYTEENPNFDPNNPLALDLKKWKKLFEERLSNPANQDLIF